MKVGLDCPRCQVALKQVSVRGLTVDLCPQCDGTWYDGDELIQVLEAPYSSVASTDLSCALIADAEAPASDAPVLGCPRCREPMRRYPFLEGCQVLADGCAEHGVWLDDGELSKLYEYLRQDDPRALQSFEARKGEASLHRLQHASSGGLLGLLAGLFKQARG